jgi:hypothetical protein
MHVLTVGKSTILYGLDTGFTPAYLHEINIWKQNVLFFHLLLSYLGCLP